jgi:3-O-alpha-D-mannopyranosyl-alpha-D-mannopyranose xylosylphosphotransferase
VANLGRSGMWTDTGRAEIMDMFGLGEEDDDVVKIEVHRGDRWTLERGRMARMFEQAGWEPPKVTEFLFCKSPFDHADCSVAGWSHAPASQERSQSDTKRQMLARSGSMFWLFLDKGRGYARCRHVQASHLPISRVWRLLWVQLSSELTSVIMALVTASGPLGLSAFFAPKDATYVTAPLSAGKPYPKYLPPPHLPLTSTWHEADFSLDSVMSVTALPDEAVNLREYSMKLLSRYIYLSGE